MSGDRVLDGKNVVVTGAGMGLGQAYAVAAANAGASVLVNDLKQELAEATAQRIVESGGRAVALAGDVADWDQAAAVVDRCVEKFGGIDGLVNNAGILGRVRPMVEETPENVRRVVDVNVLGTLYPGVHAARAMVAAGRGGAIVNVSSGNQCGHALHATYGATKGAVSTLTYAWGVELAEHEIRVNAISPNAFTNQIEEVIEQLGSNPEDRVYPAREDNAAVVIYLLSDEASALTGQIVRVDAQRVSVMAHPLVAQPGADLDDISVDSVAGAFEADLGELLQPSGIATAEIAHLGVLH